VRDFTPESATTTYVFLQIRRNYATNRLVVVDHLRTMLHKSALQGPPVLETVQHRLTEAKPRRDTSVEADRAAVGARRVTQGVDNEARRRSPRPKASGVERAAWGDRP
jgi:vanillate O-demethylase oxygenase-like protein